MLSDPRFPIGLWWPPPPEETTVAAYGRIAAAGFTFVIGGNGIDTPARNLDMLAAAEANGLLALVNDPRAISGPADEDSWRANLQEASAAYARHRSFAGYLLADEPGTLAFPWLGELSRIIREVAPGRLPYINLFPNYATAAQLQAPSYGAYLQAFRTQVQPPLLSFDHYPLLADGSVGNGYFSNWAEIRHAALAAGIPAWIFLQAIGFVGHRRPSAAEILWQANVALAFGAKGMMYFTYWTPQGAEDFTSALIDPQGRPTAAYDSAMSINLQVGVTGARLRPLRSEQVTCTGIPRLAGLEAFGPDHWVAEVAGDPVILARFSPESGGAREHWLLLTTASPADPAIVDLRLGEAVTGVAELDPDLGSLVDVPGGGRSGLRCSLAAGAARLYRLQA